LWRGRCAGTADARTCRGYPVCPTYGLTESCSQVATARHRRSELLPLPMLPLRGTELRIDVDGRDAPPGHQARSSSVADRHAGLPARSAVHGGALRGGWLHTGDIGCIDAKAPARVRPRDDLIVSAARMSIRLRSRRCCWSIHPSTTSAWRRPGCRPWRAGGRVVVRRQRALTSQHCSAIAAAAGGFQAAARVSLCRCAAAQCSGQAAAQSSSVATDESQDGENRCSSTPPVSSYSQKVLIALYENAMPSITAASRILGKRRAGVLWPLKRFPYSWIRAARSSRPPRSSSTSRVTTRLTRLIPHGDAGIEVRMLDRVFDNYVMTPMQKIVLDQLRPS